MRILLTDQEIKVWEENIEADWGMPWRFDHAGAGSEGTIYGIFTLNMGSSEMVAQCGYGETDLYAVEIKKPKGFMKDCVHHFLCATGRKPWEKESPLNEGNWEEKK